MASDKIRESAMNALLILLNHLGNFPSASGPATVSTLMVESDILSDIAAQEQIDINEARQYMRYFITEDKVVIGVIDRPGPPEAGGPATTVIVRDRTGKYAWDAALSYLPHSEQQVDVITPDDPVPVCVVPFNSEVRKYVHDRAAAAAAAAAVYRSPIVLTLLDIDLNVCVVSIRRL